MLDKGKIIGQGIIKLSSICFKFEYQIQHQATYNEYIID